MKKAILFSLLILVSCKLFQDKDTTAPLVNLSIEGGNEISREVTLYLDIEDDSKIDYVDIMIDDTTAATVTTNFDTIQFDVTPFADESEHQLYAKVADSEDNIGESEKLDVVITEFPGWRKYLTVDKSGWIMPLLVDENGFVWIGALGELLIFDPIDNSARILTQNNSELPEEYISDIVLVEGSRVWLIHDYHISEYHYGINKWIKVLPTPSPHSRSSMNWCAILDNNYNLYIGTDGNYIIKYNGAEFSFIEFPGASVFNMVYHPNDIIYYFDEWSIVKTYIMNDSLHYYQNIPFNRGYREFLIIDKFGNLWFEGNSYLGQYGCYLYDGSAWTNLRSENSTEIIFPILNSSDGTIYSMILSQNGENKGIATYNDHKWSYWNEYDAPNTLFDWTFYKSIDEAPNGDIWMIIDNVLWRYRPSLGGYP